MDGVNTYNCRCPPQWTGKYSAGSNQSGAWIGPQRQAVPEVGTFCEGLCGMSQGVVLTLYVLLCALGLLL